MDLLLITHFLNGFLMIALPVVLAIYLERKFDLGWKLWLVGAGTFIFSQVIHIPFNSFVLNPFLSIIQKVFTGVSVRLLVALLLGLSAGIFEECARYAMYRWWVRDARSWRKGFLAGAGHGGIEAILLGAIVLLSFVNLVAYRNSSLSSLNLTPDQLEIALQQIQAYWGAPWYLTMFGALERAFTIPFHILASLIVLQVFVRKPGHEQLGWLGVTILFHALMDALAVFIAGQWNAYIAEAVLGGLAIVEIIFIFSLFQPEPEPELQPASPAQSEIPSISILPIAETTENLENTRYQ